ncbi:MAG: four helix bundle protein [Candidatus Cloacimonetes bacterium]|nr:four helix bundle protein [Candidatus Cloacimonadota bacterium]
MRTHKDLVLWQKSVIFVTNIYDVTTKFPKSEIYGITNQMRRAAVSIPSNIAEGSGRRSQKELIQFLHIALGSMAELETQLIISLNLSFITPDSYRNLSDELSELSKMTISLIRSLSKEKF